MEFVLHGQECLVAMIAASIDWSVHGDCKTSYRDETRRRTSKIIRTVERSSFPLTAGGARGFESTSNGRSFIGESRCKARRNPRCPCCGGHRGAVARASQ